MDINQARRMAGLPQLTDTELNDVIKEHEHIEAVEAEGRRQLVIEMKRAMREECEEYRAKSES